MTLPAKLKTYTHTANNRSTFVSVLQVTKEILFGLKNAIKAIPGVTVKGSSNGVAAAMDAVDRWTVATDISARASNTTSPASWIVFDMPGMDNVEIALSFIGASDEDSRIAFAPGNDYALAGTATHHPVATVAEQVVLAGDLHPNTASLDRLWSVGTANDGSTIFWLVARASGFNNGGIIQKISSQVLAPATFNQAVVGWSWQPSSPVNTSMTGGSVNGVARVSSTVAAGSGVSVAVNFSVEFYAGLIGPAALAAASDLQGGGTGYLLYPIGAWSTTANARGKLGAFFDFYFGLQTAADGDVYTDDAGVTKPWIQAGDVVLPWNNSTPVLA